MSRQWWNPPGTPLPRTHGGLQTCCCRLQFLTPHSTSTFPFTQILIRQTCFQSHPHPISTQTFTMTLWNSTQCTSTWLTKHLFTYFVFCLELLFADRLTYCLFLFMSLCHVLEFFASFNKILSAIASFSDSVAWHFFFWRIRLR